MENYNSPTHFRRFDMNSIFKFTPEAIMYSWGHTLADLNEPFNVARLLKSAQHRLDLLLFLAVTFQLLASPGQAFEQKIGHANYFFYLLL